MFSIQRQHSGYLLDNELPDNYELVDFLESTGSQFIKLDYNPSSLNGKTEIITSPSSIVGTQGLWGFVQTSNVDIRLSLGISAGKWFYGAGSTNYASDVLENEVVTIIFDRGMGNITVNNTSFNYTQNEITPTYEAFLFARNDGNSYPYATSYYGRIYQFREYSTLGLLIRDMIPARNTDTLELGLFDLVNQVFYTNSGSGKFLTSSLPEEDYTEIEYIVADGEQWIDIGIPNTMDLIFEDRVNLAAVSGTPSGDGQWIIGGRVNPMNGLGLFRGTSGFFNQYGAGSLAASSNNVTANDWLKINFNRFTLSVENETTGTLRNYTVSGKKLIPEEFETNVLLGKNQVNFAGTGDDPRNMYGKRSSTKITNAENNEVLRDLVATKVNRTGVVGMLDRVHNKFYPSIGPRGFYEPGNIYSVLHMKSPTVDKTNIIAINGTTGHTPGLQWEDWSAEDKEFMRGRLLTVKWSADFDNAVFDNPRVIIGFSTNIYYEDGDDTYISCYMYLDDGLLIESGVPFTRTGVFMTKPFLVEDKPIRDVISRQAQIYVPRIASGTLRVYDVDWTTEVLT